MSTSRAYTSGMQTASATPAAMHSKHERACSCRSAVQPPSADCFSSLAARDAAGAGSIYGRRGKSRWSAFISTLMPRVGICSVPSCCTRGTRSLISFHSGRPSCVRSSSWERNRGCEGGGGCGCAAAELPTPSVCAASIAASVVAAPTSCCCCSRAASVIATVLPIVSVSGAAVSGAASTAAAAALRLSASTILSTARSSKRSS
mmetsp:Transcript_37138/g.74207  ORF Transcript_37138/g.74207 Transcript_37138/m.74207 type:complete len:204 (+) Transcript_37138:337-948(+)